MSRNIHLKYLRKFQEEANTALEVSILGVKSGERYTAQGALHHNTAKRQEHTMA